MMEPVKYRDGLRTFLLSMLDLHFKDLGHVVSSDFPDHEFSREEAESLATLCKQIGMQGYASFAASESDSWKVLDLATEYGVFVSSNVGWPYLGLFVLAEMLMKPAGIDTFIYSFQESEILARATPNDVICAARVMISMAHLYRVTGGGVVSAPLFDESNSPYSSLELTSDDIVVGMRWLMRGGVSAQAN